jgi:hypothetical protein
MSLDGPMKWTWRHAEQRDLEALRLRVRQPAVIQRAPPPGKQEKMT